MPLDSQLPYYRQVFNSPIQGSIAINCHFQAFGKFSQIGAFLRVAPPRKDAHTPGALSSQKLSNEMPRSFSQSLPFHDIRRLCTRLINHLLLSPQRWCARECRLARRIWDIEPLVCHGNAVFSVLVPHAFQLMVLDYWADLVLSVYRQGKDYACCSTFVLISVISLSARYAHDVIDKQCCSNVVFIAFRDSGIHTDNASRFVFTRADINNLNRAKKSDRDLLSIFALDQPPLRNPIVNWFTLHPFKLELRSIIRQRSFKSYWYQIHKKNHYTLTLSELSNSTYRFPPGGLSKLAILTEIERKREKKKEKTHAQNKAKKNSKEDQTRGKWHYPTSGSCVRVLTSINFQWFDPSLGLEVWITMSSPYRLVIRLQVIRVPLAVIV